MNAVEIAVVVLAAAVPLTAVSVGVVFWFFNRQAEKHLLGVLDRFLSRNMSEYGMTDLIKKEIEADQGAEQGDETEEDEVFAQYLASRQAAVETLGSVPVGEVVG